MVRPLSFRSQFTSRHDDGILRLVFQRDVLACVILERLTEVGDGDLELLTAFAFHEDVEDIALEFFVVDLGSDEMITRGALRRERRPRGG